MSWTKTIWAWCACAIVASLVLARVHPFGDAGLFAAKSAEAQIPGNAPVPPEVRAILVEKCANCHSNQTHAPFYGHFAPASWLMEWDIVEARKAMNLSLWDTWSADQEQTLAARMLRETKSRQMPPPQYRAIHWDARIADADIAAIANWVRPTSGSEPGPATQAGDAARGKALFEKRCTGCHALNQNHEGPRLQGVYGRTSGAVADFAYSAALKRANIVWDEQSLDHWLADPDAFLPGNNMDFLLPKPQERRDLISFLKLGAR